MSETTRPSLSLSDKSCRSLEWLTVSKNFDRSRSTTPDVTLICDIEGLVNGRPATPARAKAMTVQTEYWFVFVAQFLRYRLLDDSIDSSWNSQRSELAFLLLRDHDSAYGLRFVFPRLHGFHYLDGVRTQIVQELVYGHAVDARTASVCLDLLISSVQVVPFKDGF